MEKSVIKNLIQIAGIIDRAEAQMLVNAGVDWLGFPLRLPVHREDISEGEAAAIIHKLPPPHAGVLITYLDRALEVLALCRALGTNIVQLHGAISPAETRKLHELDPDLLMIKSLIVRGDNFTALRERVERFSPYVDAFITDTHDPDSGADGATGKTHDWSISRRLTELSPRPLILAGGLRPENVRDAIMTVRPAGVDAHTGVEGPGGRKSPEKIARFVAEAREAFAALDER